MAPPTEPGTAKKPSGKMLEVVVPLREPRNRSEELEDELSQETDVPPQEERQATEKEDLKDSKREGRQGKGPGPGYQSGT